MDINRIFIPVAKTPVSTLISSTETWYILYMVHRIIKIIMASHNFPKEPRKKYTIIQAIEIPTAAKISYHTLEFVPRISNTFPRISGDKSFKPIFQK